MTELKSLTEEQIISYYQGVREGIYLYAWWKDGIQYVGSCGRTLHDAIKEIQEKEKISLATGKLESLYE